MRPRSRPMGCAPRACPPATPRTRGPTATPSWPPRNSGAPRPTPPPPSWPPRAEQLGLHRKAEVLGGQLQAVESAAAAEDLAGRPPWPLPQKMCGPRRSPTPNLPRCGTTTAGSSPGLCSGDAPSSAGVATARPWTVKPCGPRWADFGPCAPCSTERLPDEARLAGLRSRGTQLRLDLEQLEDNRTSGAAALDALRTESAALLAALRPLEELAAEVQLRTKEAAAADELAGPGRRYAAAEAECPRSRCGTARRARDGVPGPAAALARSPRGAAGQRRGRARHPAPGRRPVPRLRQPRAPGPRPRCSVRPGRRRGRKGRAAGLRGGRRAALAALERELADAQQERRRPGGAGRQHPARGSPRGSRPGPAERAEDATVQPGPCRQPGPAWPNSTRRSPPRTGPRPTPPPASPKRNPPSPKSRNRPTPSNTPWTSCAPATRPSNSGSPP